MKRLLLALVLTLSPLYGSTSASPIQQVMTHHSIPNESYETFVTRIARFMNGWTKSSDAEICGILSESGTMYHVILVTTGSQLSCSTNVIVADTTPTGDTIHSHPITLPNGTIRISEKTRAVEGDTVPLVAYMHLNGNMFSEGDYKSGPGYLVVNDAVYYQKGKGTTRLIAKLPPAGQ